MRQLTCGIPEETAKVDEFASNFVSFLQSGAIFSEGNDFSIYAGISRSSSEANSHSIYAPSFHLQDARPWKRYPWHIRVSSAILLAALEGSPVVQGLADFEVLNPPDWRTFEEEFARIQAQLQAGSIRKEVAVVTSQNEWSTEIQPAAVAQILLHLIKNAQGWPLRVYGFWDQGAGMLGATPEILFRLRPVRRVTEEDENLLSEINDQVCDADWTGAWTVGTMALAGTLGVSDLSTADRMQHRDQLLGDPKERREHEIVVEDLRDALNGMGELKVGDLEVVDLPQLLHLQTQMQVEVSPGITQTGLHRRMVDLLHPTAALGISPRSLRHDWLMRQRASSRGRFGAPFGTSRECVVAIRNLQWEGSRLWLCAGCGITARSQLDAEKRELLAKLRSVRALLSNSATEKK